MAFTTGRRKTSAEAKPAGLMRINRVVTKTGDQGTTALIGGQRVLKSVLRVSAYGEVDELNSWLGLAVADVHESLHEPLETIQHRLFTVGADLAAPLEVGVPRVSAAHVAELEEIMEGLMDELPPLEEFILPGGGRGGASLHVARCVARRAERASVALAQEEGVNPEAIVFLNRLSDLLFVMARVANRREGRPETLAQFSERKKS